MNNTITLSQLITRLAKATGVDNNTARKFLKEFFGTIESTLEAGDSVSVKGIGIFRSSESDINSGKKTISFIPDAELLGDVNRPFEMFEAVELADDVDFTELDAPKAEEPITASATTPVVEPVVAPVEEPIAVEAVKEVVEDKPVVEVQPEPVIHEPELKQPKIVEHDPVKLPERPTFPDEEEEIAPASVAHSNPADSFMEEEKQKPSRIWIWTALFIGIACIVGYFAAVWLVPMPEEIYDDEYVEQDTVQQVVPTEPVAEVPAEEIKPEVTQATVEVVPEQKEVTLVTNPEPVFDTVEISLIKLAKKHYGIADYWVFIFDANSDKIKNPNAIRPGTKVRIPDVSELPGSNVQETKSIAKNKSAEYLKKY